MKINPKFKALIPPLAPEELSQFDGLCRLALEEFGTMSTILTTILDTDHRMNNSLRQHCDWCPEMIEPGESIWRIKLPDGESLRMHHECFVAACPDGEVIETGTSHMHRRGSKELINTIT